MEPELLNGTIESVGTILAATGALGTASFGLVDASKAFRGGISNMGYGFIDAALVPFEAALTAIDKENPYAALKANWLNGMDKAEQKSTARNLIRLGLTSATARSLADRLPSVDGVRLTEVARKIEAGTALAEEDANLLGRFDAIVDARLDAAFERADQKYRNTARVVAAGVALILALIGAFLVTDGSPSGSDIGTAVLIGIVATPMAPIAKDIASAISTAVAAFKSRRR